MAVTAKRICLAVFMGCREVAHESSSSKNENYTEEHFVRNGLFSGIGRGCADRDPDRAALRRKGVWSTCEQIRRLHGCCTQRLNEQLQGIEHEVVIGEGMIWEVMSNLIEQKEIDLIVLGTRGRTGLGR